MIENNFKHIIIHDVFKNNKHKKKIVESNKG